MSQQFDIRNDITQVIQAKKNTINELEKHKNIQIQNTNIFINQVNILIASIDAAINAENEAIKALIASANGQLMQQQTQAQQKPEILKSEVKVEIIEKLPEGIVNNPTKSIDPVEALANGPAKQA